MSKVFIIKSLFPKRFIGMAFWPFIIVKNLEYTKDAVFINHERIHLRQQVELLVVPFYIWYGLEYLLRLLCYKDRHVAYRNISFEREAYENEREVNYLKNRPFWNFRKFL